jgi:hypothetical protein
MGQGGSAASRGWRIVYSIRNLRTGQPIEGRVWAFAKRNGPGSIRMATNEELQPGTPIELQLSIVSEGERAASPVRGASVRGRVTETSPNTDPGEPAYIVGVSVDAAEWEQQKAA